ncbi:MAG TPA: hypothetical protein VH061_00570 [Solirubrobacteraceae bacterium]|jgi:hypothetical protein|nr:hypothetical protein [Solirubrobacteraceae bacterium]
MDRIRRHLSYANVVATLALVFAMSGGAIAASGGFSSGGRLRACVNGEGGLRLLKSGKHCARGQKTVAWNQQGPAGAPGAKGAGGATGAAGSQGKQGLSGSPVGGTITGGSLDGVEYEETGQGGYIAGSGFSNVGDETVSVPASAAATVASNLHVTTFDHPLESPFLPAEIRFRLVVNHSPTDLSCVIISPSEGCSDASDTASVPADATLAIGVEPETIAVSMPRVLFAYELGSD